MEITRILIIIIGLGISTFGILNLSSGDILTNWINIGFVVVGIFMVLLGLKRIIKKDSFSAKGKFLDYITPLFRG